MNKIATAAALMSLVLAGAAIAAEDAHNTDLVLPNSPQKPDAGQFNPVGDPIHRQTKRVVYPAPIAFPEPERVYAERQPLFVIVEPMRATPAAPRKRRQDRN